MAEMLTYHQSKSSEYTWKTQSKSQYADENFAREVMQLFTVGINKINIDGTLKLDSQGNPSLVYSNEDIIEYSRAWTGFGTLFFFINLASNLNINFFPNNYFNE